VPTIEASKIKYISVEEIVMFFVVQCYSINHIEYWFYLYYLYILFK